MNSHYYYPKPVSVKSNFSYFFIFCTFQRKENRKYLFYLLTFSNVVSISRSDYCFVNYLEIFAIEQKAVQILQNRIPGLIFLHILEPVTFINIIMKFQPVFNLLIEILHKCTKIQLTFTQNSITILL